VTYATLSYRAFCSLHTRCGWAAPTTLRFSTLTCSSAFNITLPCRACAAWRALSARCPARALAPASGAPAPRLPATSSARHSNLTPCFLLATHHHTPHCYRTLLHQDIPCKRFTLLHYLGHLLRTLSFEHILHATAWFHVCTNALLPASNARFSPAPPRAARTHLLPRARARHLSPYARDTRGFCAACCAAWRASGAQRALPRPPRSCVHACASSRGGGTAASAYLLPFHTPCGAPHCATLYVRSAYRWYCDILDTFDSLPTYL